MGTKQSKLDETGDVSSPAVKIDKINVSNNDTKQSPAASPVKMMRHTSISMPTTDVLIDLTPDEDVSMFSAPHPDHIPLHVENAGDFIGEDLEFVDFCVKLMPHQHTLFCERRERVCEAVGKIQEGEELEVDGLVDAAGGYWIRSLRGNKRSAYSFIEGTENCSRYTLTAEDEGRFIAFQYAQLLRVGGERNFESNRDGTIENPTSSPLVTPKGERYEIKRTINSLGPVRPGPPRVLNLQVTGKSFQVGESVRAECKYIGGREGLSEYWWFKIMKGKRIQLTEPLSILNNEPGNVDPRVYELKEDDVECVLKVKCRPIRSDGHIGEIFTSKPSTVVRGRYDDDI